MLKFFKNLFDKILFRIIDLSGVSPEQDARAVKSERTGYRPESISYKNFQILYAEKRGQTFSKMLIRLIAESGEKNSTIYTRANIDRRHFSKIANNINYQPSKQTALAFAIALKLDHEKTKKLLETAGYTLTNAIFADFIVSLYIERKIFDVDLINQVLYENNQPLLGG